MPDPKQCAVLVPVARDLEPQTQQCLSVLGNRGYPIRLLKGGSQVDLVRSAMASMAFQDGFAETLWVDSDIVFDPDDVEKLRAHDRPFTAGLYVKRGADEFACKFRPGPSITFGVGGGLVEMEYVGMGFTHIRREVYRTIAHDLNLPACGGNYDPKILVRPYFIPMIVPEGSGWCYLSEDYSFCHRARSVGFAPFADTTIRLGHGIGDYKRTWDDLEPRRQYSSIVIDIGGTDERGTTVREDRAAGVSGRESGRGVHGAPELVGQGSNG